MSASRIIVGALEAITIYVPDSSAIVSTGGGESESLKDLLDSKEDVIQLTAQRAVATTPAGKLLASLVTLDELNTLRTIDTSLRIEDRFDAIAQVVDTTNTRRFEYTWTGSEGDYVYVPMMKFPRLNNTYTGTIRIRGTATFTGAFSTNLNYFVNVDSTISINGSGGVSPMITMRGSWAPTSSLPPFDIEFVNVQVGGQQGTIYTWVCAKFDAFNGDFTPREFNLVLETDMSSLLLANDAPIVGSVPNSTGTSLTFTADAQILESHMENATLRDNTLRLYPYEIEGTKLTIGDLVVNTTATFEDLIPMDGFSRPAIIDSGGRIGVASQATQEDIDAIPQMRTNLALLATSIEYDPDTRSLYLGKSDMADTIYISNPASSQAQTIYLGSALDHVIIQGDTTIIESETHNVTDPYMTLNVGGTSTVGAGIRVEANAVVAASLLLNGDGRWVVTEPASGSPFAISSRFATNESAISALQAQIGGGGGEGLTGNRALVTTSGGVITTHASTTDTQIGYLSDVTGLIQAQIDGKQATITGAASTAVSSNFTAGCGVITDGSGKLAVDTQLTTTKLGYIKGLTSDAQTQIDGKQATITGAASTAVSSNFTADRGVISNSSGKLEASIVTKTELECLSGVTGPIQDQIDAAAGSLVTDVSLSTPSTFNISDEDALRMYKLGTNNFGTWTNYGAAGPDNTVSYMYVHGTDLYISGTFTTINGVTMNRIAKYDTTTGQWSTFGSGLAAAAIFMEVYNGYLYAVGSFTSPGTRAVRWDLTNGGWSTVGPGISSTGTVRSAYLDTGRDMLWTTGGSAISVFDLANGGARTTYTATASTIVYGVAVIGDYAYVCGTFGDIGGVTAVRLARFNLNTSTWGPMPGDATVSTLPNTLYRYGTNLFYCGWMNNGGTATSRGIVRYDTATDTWYPLGDGGVSGSGDRTVSKIGIYDASTETFWVNGSFTSAVGTALTVEGIILYNLQSNSWSAIPEAASVGPGVQHMARINNDVFLGGTSTTTAGYFAVRREKVEVKTSDGSAVIHEFNANFDQSASIVPHDFKVAGDTYLNVGGATEKVLTVDAEGKVAAASSPSLTELGYVAGATSSLQTQLNTIFDPTAVQIASADVTEFNRYYVPYSGTAGSIITKYELTGTDHGKSRTTGGTFASFGTTDVVLFDDNNMYISGWFNDVNSMSGTRGIVYYNDKSKTFQALNGGGAGSGSVYSLRAIDHILYAAGFVASGFGGNASIAYIGRYDTVDKTWSLLGGAAPNNTVLSTYVVGRYLFAVGQFSDIGSLGILAMGRYDMETDTWSAVFDDLTTASNKWVTAIGAFGTDVYVTGSFTSIVVDAVGVPNTNGGGKLDVLTGTWSSQFGSDLQVIPLVSYPVRGYMYARINGGSTGVANTTYLARYDLANEVWEAVGGTGPNNTVSCAYHDGDNIYFGGSFTSCNSVTGTSYFARYHIPTDTYFATGLSLSARVLTITPTSNGEFWLCGDFAERFMLYSPNVHVYKNGIKVTTLSADSKPSAYVIN